MAAVAEALDAEWAGSGFSAHYIPEFYTYDEVIAYMENDLGAVQTQNDGIHDDPAITSMMMVADPNTVRYEQRVAANLATINGVSIAPKEEAIERGKKLLAFRVERTAEAIRHAIAGS